MATSDRLTEAHRLQQVRLGALTTREVLALWRLIDLDDLDASAEIWVRAVARIVAQQRDKSAALARRYLVAHRSLILGASAPAVVGLEVPELVVPALRSSLLTVGPYGLRNRVANRGLTVARASDIAKVEASRVAMRESLAGGRGLIDRVVNRDRAVQGVQRRTASSPCSFCALLASRGAVYKSEETARFSPHSGCGCQPEPVYSRKQKRTPQAERFYKQYDQAADRAYDEGVSVDVMFRRIREGRA